MRIDDLLGKSVPDRDYAASEEVLSDLDLGPRQLQLEAVTPKVRARRQREEIVKVEGCEAVDDAEAEDKVALQPSQLERLQANLTYLITGHSNSTKSSPKLSLGMLNLI